MTETQTPPRDSYQIWVDDTPMASGPIERPPTAENLRHAAAMRDCYQEINPAATVLVEWIIR
jgi:hypothetical protein